MTQRTSAGTSGAHGENPRTGDHGWLAEIPIAHRGLHSPGIPENSRVACREAIRNGYAIELDVRRTRDDVLVVFHDRNLLRMTGLDRNVDSCLFGDLSEARLSGTGERIPDLAGFLGEAAGRVGLLIEVKPDANPSSTNALLARMLDNYRGPFVIASFDPFILRWFRKNRPSWARVQITGLLDRAPIGRLRRFLVRNLLVMVISRPNYVACETRNLRPWIRLVTMLCRTPIIVWTVRDPVSAEALKKTGANIIFEGFRYRKS